MFLEKLQATGRTKIDLQQNSDRSSDPRDGGAQSKGKRKGTGRNSLWGGWVVVRARAEEGDEDDRGGAELGGGRNNGDEIDNLSVESGRLLLGRDGTDVGCEEAVPFPRSGGTRGDHVAGSVLTLSSGHGGR